METPDLTTSFSKSVLAGLLTGVIAAFVNLIYVVVFRETSNFGGDEIIVMPLTIFIGFPILLVIAGCAYYLFKRHLPSGTLWFIGISLATMVALIIVTVQDTPMNQGTFFSGARGLFLGMVIITFLLAAFLVPYFATHSKIFI